MAMEEEKSRIIEVSVEDEMRSSYIDYAMSVIVGRALPDAYDGLKPVQRRILYAMHEVGITSDKPYKKSARIVGEVLGKYHPHGDVAVYDTMVRMAQNFSFRYPLIDGQGNFGSIDGDEAAAMRYTEARLSKIAAELLRDIEKETVLWGSNFDNSLKEPLLLPAKFPNLLVNGSSGIAVGMATNMPPHNLYEVVDAIITTIDEPDVSTEKLMKIIKAPDFPTGGVIAGIENIKKAYETGRGSIRVKARVEIEREGKTERIVVTEIPYQVNKSKLIEDIAELVRKDKVESIAGVRDESDRSGMRIVINLKPGANSSIVLNKLYKYTQLENTFGIINLALVDGVPRILSLKELIECYVKHRKEITVKRLQYELERAERRKHILEGLVIALMHIEGVVALLKASKDNESAKESLKGNFSLTAEQAKAILDMRLSRLSALERGKIEKEKEEKEKEIAQIKEILSSEEEIFEVIKEELRELKEKYGDERRTKIEEKWVELGEKELIEEKKVFVVITGKNYVKRIPENVFKRQRRGGKGVGVIDKKEKDTISSFVYASTRERLIFFTSFGRAYQVKTHEIAESSRHARGKPLVNIISGAEVKEKEKEKIISVVSIPEEADKKKEDFFLIFVTKRGIVKKSSLAKFKHIRSIGVASIKIEERKGDALAGVALMKEGESVIIGTKRGKAILFDEKEIRKMGKYAIGVRGVKLGEDDEVTSIDTIEIEGAVLKEKEKILTVTGNGYGKRTNFEKYRRTHRGSKGVVGMRISEKNRNVVCMKAVKEEEDVMIATSGGMVIKLSTNGIPTQGRNTQGVRLIGLNKGEKVMSVEVV